MKTIKNLKRNQGFTLIELMVSVAIFALICSPLIHSYLSAQSTSRRSHFLGDATLASSNIIETIKAVGAEAVIFNPSELGTATDCDCVPQVHSFHLMSYPAGMSAFDVAVTLDSDEFDVINSVSITDYSPMDGIFAQSQGVDNPDVMAEIYLENLANISGINFVSEDVRRVIRAEVSENNNEVKIHAIYTYSFDVFEFVQEYEFFRERLCDDTCTRCVKCVSKSIYICYQPFYRGIDIIEIDNTAGMNLTVFVVKQFPDFSKEAGYSAIIKQYEQDTEPGNEKTQIFSNFNINLNNDSVLSACQLWIHRFGSVYDTTSITSGELVSRTERNRMYSVEVAVYARGALESGGRAMLRTIAAQLN
jgi:prepilin-type N-terminal cleavage/methylation domain-containing protein